MSTSFAACFCACSTVGLYTVWSRLMFCFVFLLVASSAVIRPFTGWRPRRILKAGFLRFPELWKFCNTNRPRATNMRNKRKKLQVTPENKNALSHLLRIFKLRLEGSQQETGTQWEETSHTEDFPILQQNPKKAKLISNETTIIKLPYETNCVGFQTSSLFLLRLRFQTGTRSISGCKLRDNQMRCRKLLNVIGDSNY